MAKKKRGSKKDGGGGGGDGDMLKRENVLQAVLMADSFQVYFRPMTLEKPKVLLPLVNVPMINYTLELLASNGVHEVFVLCCAHADKMEAHLEESVYKRTMKLHVIHCENSFSEGDALRHIEQMHVLKSDFILIGGDVIANINLKHVLEQHNAKRKEDKLNVMTVVLKRAEPEHRTRGHADRAVVVLDADTKQLLVYDNDTEESKTELEISLINEHPKVEFRHDLMDTHIYICGLDVLDLLTENFDWQSIQRHLLKGVLGDFVLGNKVCSHIITGEYAARVQDPKSYHSISKDVIQRWTYPMVPEYNLISDTSYQVYRHNIYKEKKVRLAESAKLTCNTVIGSGSSIGADCILDQCILGRDVVVGKGCVLRHCYLWDGCRLGDGCSVTTSIIGHDVVLENRVTVHPNCLIGSGVTVEANREIPALSRLSAPFDFEDAEQDAIEEAKARGRQLCGQRAPGMAYAPELEEIEDDPFEQYCLVPVDAVAWPQDEDEDEEEDDHEFGVTSAEGKEGGAEAKEDLDEDAKLKFEREMVETLSRGVQNNLDVDGIVLEAGSLKLTHHALLEEYYAAVFRAFFSLTDPPPREGKQAGRETMFSLMSILKVWKPVIAKFAKATDDQKLMLDGLATCCRRHPASLSLLDYTLNLLYDWELVDEDAALDWEDELRQSAIPEDVKTLECATNFLTFLKEADEESDE